VTGRGLVLQVMFWCYWLYDDTNVTDRGVVLLVMYSVTGCVAVTGYICVTGCVAVFLVNILILLVMY
jgi:hypothetical protein